MDPFTEKLLERTRARRENLQKKMASRPAAAASSTKRTREPLTESNTPSHIDTAPQPSSKPSPSKRSRSGEMAPPQLATVGEENREPTPAARTLVPSALTLEDPRTDRKPPVGPASLRSSSSLEKKSMTRPVVQNTPPEQTMARPVVQTTPVVVQTPPEQVPEPERMVAPSAATEPQRSQEPQRTERPAPAPEPEGQVSVVPAGRKQVQLDREAVPKDDPPPATAGGGMKSRLQRLAEKRHCWDNEGDGADDMPVGPPPSPLKRQEVCPPPPAPTTSSDAPMGRRGRLANLAATIGSWEDDLSHPVTRNEDNEQEKAGTAWAAKMAARDAAAKQPAAASSAVSAAARQPAAASTTVSAPAKQPVASAATQQRVQASSKAPASSNQAAVAPSSAQQQAAVPGVRGPLAQAGRGPASPQKKASTQEPSYPASPQKAGPSSASLVVSQSPRKDRGLDFTFSSSKKPELGAKPLATGPSAGPSAPQSRERVPTKDPGTPLPQKTTAGPTGVKSFVERFGERCQERSNQGSPAAAGSSHSQLRTPGAAAVPPSTRTPAAVTLSTRTVAVTPGVSPSTRLVQERLRAAQAASTATADLTQRQKLERESELAQIRSRFQKGSGNMWKSKEEETEPTAPNKHQEETPAPRKHPEVKVVETDCSQSVDDGEDFSTTSTSTCPTEPFSTASNLTSAGNLLVVSPPAATSSPMRRLDLLVTGEKTSTSSTCSSSSSPLRRQEEETPSASTFSTCSSSSSPLRRQEEKTSTSTFSTCEEVEQSVDQSINSAVINGLFEGVYDEEEDDEEDALNISSMSLLAPLEETVAAVVKSPERRMMMTSTPAGSFSENSKTPDCMSKPSKFQRARVTRGGSSDGIDDNLPYSVDAYRSIKKKDVDRPEVKQVIVRKEDVSQRLEDEPRASSAASIKHRMKMLNNDMSLQQTIIHQASQALNCCTDEEHGKGSQVEAEAERLLLIATERRATVKAELEQLKGQGSGSAGGQKQGSAAGGSKAQEEVMGVSASKGSICLQELRLPLKADFVCSAANKPESANHYFFLMIRAGAENTVATALASTRSALSGDALTFNTKFSMPDVSSDFEIDIEVYYLVQKRELCSDKRKKPSKSKAITPKRFLAITKTSQTPVLASPGGPNSVRTSNFSLVGSHKLTLASIGKTKFPLTKVPFLCPLEGHIHLKMQCQVGCSVEERGFLTMFEDVSGFGAWHRRWCVLSGYCISYWTYPDDERRKKPMGRLNLANCTSRKVEPANREFCARPNTLELVTVRPQRDEDKETLVSQCHNTMCVTKNWLSADTKDERNLWMLKLNQVLVDLRMWQPDSCYRPQ